jgi:hypothetical protein
MDIDTKGTVNNSLVAAHASKKSKWIRNLIIHYTHEARHENYKRDIHQLWNQIFKDTATMNTTLLI